MRIDSYYQVNQLYGGNTSRKSPYSSQSGKRDSLEISDLGSAYHVAKNAAAEGSDVRADKVAEIKAKIKNGTYNVSLSDVAEKMADRLLAG
jgi:negative regulator of flagellin synthesis FlgM